MNLKRRLATTFALVFVAGASWPQVTEMSAEELVRRIADGTAPLILDVRSDEEFEAGRVPGAIHIPHTELANRLDELRIAMDAEVVVYCGSGRRAGMAEELLGQSGYTNVKDLEGHFSAWSAAGRPIEQEE